MLRSFKIVTGLEPSISNSATASVSVPSLTVTFMVLTPWFIISGTFSVLFETISIGGVIPSDTFPLNIPISASAENSGKVTPACKTSSAVSSPPPAYPVVCSVLI